MDVKTTVNKWLYTIADSKVNFSYKIDVGKSEVKREIKRMHASLVRALHIGTGYEGGLERHKELQVLVEPISVPVDNQGEVTINFPQDKNLMPWIIGTSLRCMYFVKLEIVSKHYPDDPYIVLTPVFIAPGASDWPAPTVASNQQQQAIRAVYRTLAYNMEITKTEMVKIVLPKSASPDFKFLKKLGTIAKSQIPS